MRSGRRLFIAVEVGVVVLAAVICVAVFLFIIDVGWLAGMNWEVATGLVQRRHSEYGLFAG